MLVLSRKKRESVVLTVGGERIVITLIDVQPNKVRLGFVASDNVHINREEVQDSLDKYGRHAKEQQ
jgi:carbon storage regulator CsrA